LLLANARATLFSGVLRPYDVLDTAGDLINFVAGNALLRGASVAAASERNARPPWRDSTPASPTGGEITCTRFS